MIWVKNKTPEVGDQLRAKRDLDILPGMTYYHHGIYIGEGRVIQFGSRAEVLDVNQAEVLESSLEGFIKTSDLEIASYTSEELKEKRSVSEIVEIAKSRLGEKGYSITENNCEHFCNEVMFDKKISYQIEELKQNGAYMLLKMLGL